jgi:hypothetical protein
MNVISRELPLRGHVRSVPNGFPTVQYGFDFCTCPVGDCYHWLYPRRLRQRCLFKSSGFELGCSALPRECKRIGALACELDRPRVLKIVRKYLKPKQRIFVGAIAPIDPRIETAGEVRDRVLEASEYIPVEQLGNTDPSHPSAMNLQRALIPPTPRLERGLWVRNLPRSLSELAGHDCG